jgi:GNAT superfamily N-acetyltransferase
VALRVRLATPDDYELLVRFFRYFAMPDPDPTREWWQRFHVNARFLEDESGRVVGYGLGYKLEETGYVMHVSVEPDARNRGVGRAVMDAMANKLRDDGCKRWTLNVREDNAPALALYRRVGMEVDFAVAAMRIEWSKVTALPESRSVVESFAEADDRALEDLFHFERGRLRRQRELGDRVLLRAREGDQVVGITGFDPAFPGAPLFRARDASVMRALLDGMRAHARPEFDYVRFVLEGDEELARATEQAGGERVMSLLHMAGPLP